MMYAATLDDLFKTTFKCPLPHCGEFYNTAEEANEHIWSAHGLLDEKPVVTFDLESLDELPLISSNVESAFELLEETTFDLGFLDVEAEVIPESKPEVSDQNQNLVSETNPFLSQSLSFQSIKKVQPIHEDFCEYKTFCI